MSPLRTEMFCDLTGNFIWAPPPRQTILATPLVLCHRYGMCHGLSPFPLLSLSARLSLPFHWLLLLFSYGHVSACTASAPQSAEFYFIFFFLSFLAKACSHHYQFLAGLHVVRPPEFSAALGLQQELRTYSSPCSKSARRATKILVLTFFKYKMTWTAVVIRRGHITILQCILETNISWS